MYEMLAMKGWPPEKLVVGLVTNPQNGSGFVPLDVLAAVLPLLAGQHAGRFGGVMGWEYFNSLPGGPERPWEWARWMTSVLRGDRTMAPEVVMPVGRIEVPAGEAPGGDGGGGGSCGSGGEGEGEADPDDGKGEAAPLPGAFEYYSDGLGDDD
jgi:hypothetical protein